MAHYNGSWGLPPLMDGRYMWGAHQGTTENDLRAAIEGYLLEHAPPPDVVAAFGVVANRMGWTWEFP